MLAHELTDDTVVRLEPWNVLSRLLYARFGRGGLPRVSSQRNQPEHGGQRDGCLSVPIHGNSSHCTLPTMAAATGMTPAGTIDPIVRMKIADSFLEGRLENEVRYYDHPGAARVRSLDPQVNGRVPRPYRGDLSTADSVGAWAASAVDLLRFVSAVDGRGDDDILGAGTIDLMIERPDYVDGVVWYGFGWLARELDSGATNWWHHGNMPGTMAFFARAGNGHAWAVLMNSRPNDRRPFQRALDKGMWKALRQVTRWPDHDLFPQFQ